MSVECELGVLAGVEDDVSAEKSTYTNPEEVIDFAARTECDSLAISIGTSHGANKFTPEQCSRNEEGILSVKVICYCGFDWARQNRKAQSA